MGTRSFYVEAFTIPSAGMSPTLVIGDPVFVKKYDTDVVRGDVAVFTYPSNERLDYIKRVVAVEGDTVEIRCLQLHINGVAVPRQVAAGECTFDDFDRSTELWETEPCTRFVETLDGQSFSVFEEPGSGELFKKARSTRPGTAANVWWSSQPGRGSRWKRINRRAH